MSPGELRQEKGNKAAQIGKNCEGFAAGVRYTGLAFRGSDSSLQRPSLWSFRSRWPDAIGCGPENANSESGGKPCLDRTPLEVIRLSAIFMRLQMVTQSGDLL